MRLFFQLLSARRHRRERRRCSFCGAALYAGEPYWYANGSTACEDCFPTFARQELASLHCTCEEGDEIP